MITLRHFAPEDAPFVSSELYPGMEEAEAVSMIDEWNTCVYQGQYCEVFAVVYDGKIVGFVSLYEHSRSVASVGAEICRAEQGKGFATEAVAALADLAAQKGYRVLLDQVRPENRASIRLHETLGFESDHYIYRNQRNHDVFLFVKPV